MKSYLKGSSFMVCYVLYEDISNKVQEILKNDTEYNNLKTNKEKVKYRLKKEYLIYSKECEELNILDWIYYSILVCRDKELFFIYYRLIIKAEKLIKENPSFYNN